MVEWSYFKRFEAQLDKYMPNSGEGDTMASQIATAVNKLVYKWYNDGDVYDNTWILEGWCNDLSSYANWIAKCVHLPYCDICEDVLVRVFDIYNDDGYESILKDLADILLDADVLEHYAQLEKVGSIYDCDGQFRFVDYYNEEEDC